MTTTYRYLGYGVTNNNGVAKLDHDANGDPITHSYTGSGAGKVDIVASLDDNTHISESSIQSEIFEVEDCKFLDTFTTDTSSNYFLGGGSLSISDGVFHYTGSGTDSNNYFNIRGAVTPNINLFKGNTAIFKVDVSNLPTGVTARVMIYQTVNGSTLPTYTDHNSSGLCSHSAFIDSNATAIVFRLQFLGLGSNTVDIDNFRVY